jgi:hypothetical protein
VTCPTGHGYPQARGARPLAVWHASEPQNRSPGLPISAFKIARRDTVLFDDALRTLAQGVGATVVNPFLDHGFVAALGGATRRLGFGNRRATITALFPDVMPSALLERHDKAVLDEVFWGEATRTLTREWDGRLLDCGLIDPVELHSLWATGQPWFRTALLVHQVWLAGSRERPASNPTELAR